MVRETEEEGSQDDSAEDGGAHVLDFPGDAGGKQGKGSGAAAKGAAKQRPPDQRHYRLKPEALLDPKLKEKLEFAAAAVGMTVPELAAAAAGSIRPPSVSNDLTVEEVGTFLFQRYQTMMQVEPEIRMEWFSGLTDTQKDMLCCWLVDKGFAPLHLASELGITVDEVRKSWDLYVARLGSTVQNVKMDALVGTLTARADHLFQMAMEGKDARLAWTIQKDQVKLLQDLGVVRRAVYRQEVVHEMGEGARAELDRMLALREKEKHNLELADGAVDAEYQTSFKSASGVEVEQEVDLATVVAEEEVRQKSAQASAAEAPDSVRTD